MYIFLFLFVLSYATYSQSKRTISVVGKAEDAKDGAIVVTNNNKIFYVDGLDFWDKKLLGKKIKVTGTLVIERLMKDDKSNAEVQEIVGIKRIIKTPKWDLID